MTRTLDAVLQSWPFDPFLLLQLALTAGLYLRGWWRMRERVWRAGCFFGGLLAVALALASPIEVFADLLLQVHMIQHLLLMMLAPPLLWLGRPGITLLRGLPLVIQREVFGPFLRWHIGRRVLDFLGHPVTALVIFTLFTWLWHIPFLFETALRSPSWHRLEHAMFLGSALLFWYGVILAGEGKTPWPRWIILPCLFLADVQNTVLSALLTFSPRLLFPHYAEVPRLGGSPLEDQAAAGVMMWVPGSIAYLLPLGWLSYRILFRPAIPRTTPPQRRRIALPVIGPAEATRPTNSTDLLRIPILGSFLRWRYARAALAFPLVLLSLLVIVDGLWGPPIAPLNLAGVLPWIHWRGLLVLGLLVLGNVFCMACPFQFLPTLLRRWWRPQRSWPRFLANKAVAIGFLVAFFGAYEVFALWNDPRTTALLALGYFAVALVLAAAFKDAVFCKHLCPIGQFNFVGSLISPFGIRVADPAVCEKCTGRDCLAGNERQGGCGTRLLAPAKAGNLDCTLCLDCVRACPHDNLTLSAAWPLADLDPERKRSGVGRWLHRPDVALLFGVFTFAAFVNAAGMVAPVIDWQDRFTTRFLPGHPSLVVLLGYALSFLVVAPVAVFVATLAGRYLAGETESTFVSFSRYACALVPLGMGMWLAHYSFHLLAGPDAATPAIGRFLADAGWATEPSGPATCCCCLVAPGWLLRLEIVFLDLGLLGTLYATWKIARQRHGPTRQAIAAFLPRAGLALLLFALGLWLIFQPMQMRGT